MPHLRLPTCLLIGLMRPPLPWGKKQTPGGMLYRIFLLSQDKDEIFLPLPYFVEDYGNPYKNIEDLEEKNFLIMREYGPFRLKYREHLNHIAIFLHTGSSKPGFTQAECHSLNPSK